jgi:hypothetical protein
LSIEKSQGIANRARHSQRLPHAEGGQRFELDMPTIAELVTTDTNLQSIGH